MTFVVERRPSRDRRGKRRDWLLGLPEEDVLKYARYLERMLQRRGVKYPGARFRVRRRRNHSVGCLR